MSIKGNTETRESLVGNIHLLKKIPGYSAYEIAVKHGFKGTEEEWLVSISAYGIAVKLGFEGTVEEWISSLEGKPGETGSLELSGALDALGKNIYNLADPIENADATIKKYVDAKDNEAKKYTDDKHEEAKKYIDENFIKNDSQLNANSKPICNVPAPVNATDAVNKQYVHDNFATRTIEDISEAFINQVYAGNTVSNVSVFKQGNIISGTVSIRGDLNQTGLINLFQIKSAYKPAAIFFSPSLITTYSDSSYSEVGDYYLEEAPKVYIEPSFGVVIASGLDDFNASFANEITFGFTYFSK